MLQEETQPFSTSEPNPAVNTPKAQRTEGLGLGEGEGLRGLGEGEGLRGLGEGEGLGLGLLGLGEGDGLGLGEGEGLGLGEGEGDGLGGLGEGDGEGLGASASDHDARPVLRVQGLQPTPTPVMDAIVKMQPCPSPTGSVAGATNDAMPKELVIALCGAEGHPGWSGIWELQEPVTLTPLRAASVVFRTTAILTEQVTWAQAHEAVAATW